MKLIPIRTAILAALTMAVALPASQSVAAQPTKKTTAAPAVKADWLRAIRRTSEGAIVIGNPAAKAKIVEYLSLTCPHCGALAIEAMPPLQRDYIARGLASLEIRHAVRDGYDFVASLLLRCEPPARYLASIEALYATQPQWMERAISASSTPGFDAMSPDQKMAAAAKAAGFQSFFQARGMTPNAYAACMADAKAKEQLTAMTGNSWERDKIPGTPTIEINGKRQDHIHGWAEFEPLIKAALK